MHVITRLIQHFNVLGTKPIPTLPLSLPSTLVRPFGGKEGTIRLTKPILSPQYGRPGYIVALASNRVEVWEWIRLG
jgi:hypothetical protein